MRETKSIQIAKDGRGKRGDTSFPIRFFSRTFTHAAVPNFKRAHSSLMSNGMLCNQLKTIRVATFDPSLDTRGKTGIFKPQMARFEVSSRILFSHPRFEICSQLSRHPVGCCAARWVR